jgi:hypothetical protein
MMQTENVENLSFDNILEKLHSLETRLERLEGKLSSDSFILREGTAVMNDDDEGNLVEVDKAVIESNVVEYGLAWVGSIVLLFGITFLMTFTQNHVNGVLASLIGYLAVASVFLIGYYLRNSFPHLSYMLNIGAHLLLFYVTLRLYFFSPQPVIPVKSLVILLMFLAAVVELWSAYRRNSQLMGSVGILLILATAIISDSTYFTLSLLVMASAVSLFLFIRFGWWRQVILAILLVYFCHALWLFGNPPMEHPFGVVPTHQFNLLFLFAYGTIFSLIPLVKQRGNFPDSVYATAIILNGVSFSAVIMLVVLSFFTAGYVWIFGLISAICLIYSIFLKFRTSRLFDSAFFACFSFMSLSIAVYGYSNLPGAYLLLSLQSLLVVSWALWFRSKIIVVMNTFLFVGMLLVYLSFSHPVNQVNFAFAVTAFVSARIINWKRERLTLQTDMIRNVYLLTLFVTVLFALYHAVPRQYITLSWTGAALSYFMLSLVLKNIKYRWMAISTLLVTAVYLFMYDFAHMEVGYRVIAFLFLAFITLGASLYFTKQMKRKKQDI